MTGMFIVQWTGQYRNEVTCWKNEDCQHGYQLGQSHHSMLESGILQDATFIYLFTNNFSYICRQAFYNVNSQTPTICRLIKQHL